MYEGSVFSLLTKPPVPLYMSFFATIICNIDYFEAIPVLPSPVPWILIEYIIFGGHAHLGFWVFLLLTLNATDE